MKVLASKVVGLSGRREDLYEIRKKLKEEYGILFNDPENCEAEIDLLISTKDDEVIEIYCDMYLVQGPVFGTLEIYLTDEFNFSLFPIRRFDGDYS